MIVYSNKVLTKIKDCIWVASKSSIIVNRMDIRIIIKIHELLNIERTGSPKELGLKLGICERSVFNYISYMKSELEAPIIYNSRKESYCYINDCELNFKG